MTFQDKNWAEIKNIKHLILSSKEYIVFIDEEFDVDWETSEEFDKRECPNINRKNSIFIKAANLECIPTAHQKGHIRINFKRMIAEGVLCNLQNDFDNADKMLEDAKKYICKRNLEIARYWQLYASLFCGIVSSIIIFLIWTFREFAIAKFDLTAFILVLVSLAGSVGATLSCILRIGKTNLTSEAEKRLHVLESFSRNFGGAVSALVIGILVKIGILFPHVSESKLLSLTMFACGLIAGAGERWIPSIITKFENESLKIGAENNDA